MVKLIKKALLVLLGIGVLILLILLLGNRKFMYGIDPEDFSIRDKEFLDVKKIDLEKMRSYDEVLWEDAKKLIMDFYNGVDFSDSNTSINITEDDYNHMVWLSSHEKWYGLAVFYVIEKDDKAVVIYYNSSEDYLRNGDKTDETDFKYYTSFTYKKLYLTKVDGIWTMVDYYRHP